MSLSIFYTPRAQETLTLTYNFISKEFGVNSAKKFSLKAEKTIKLIADHPFMFKASAIDENVRIAFITKQCSLFYRVTDNSVHLLFFGITVSSHCYLSNRLPLHLSSFIQALPVIYTKNYNK